MDELDNFRHRRPVEIDLDISRAHVQQYRWLSYLVSTPMAVLAVIVLIASVVPQGVENINNTIVANQEP